MTIAINVKGYVNWDDWGAENVLPLKSYQEIIAMTFDNAKIELNLYPYEYYLKFLDEWHLTQVTWNVWWLMSSNTVYNLYQYVNWNSWQTMWYWVEQNLWDWISSWAWWWAAIK